MTQRTTHLIPPADAVDYTDPRAVSAYAQLLAETFAQTDGFAPNNTTTPHTHNTPYTPQLNHALRCIRQQLDTILSAPIPHTHQLLHTSTPSLADAPAMLDAYDLLHRIAYSMSDADYVRRTRIEIADRWAKGDKSISTEAVARALRRQLDLDPRSLPRPHALLALSRP